MDINTLFSQGPSLTNVEGDYVKDQEMFTEYYAGYGFFPNILLSTDTSLMVLLESGGSISITGLPTALPKTITLDDGWNYLPCPYQTAIPLADAAPSLVRHITHPPIRRDGT